MRRRGPRNIVNRKNSTKKSFNFREKPIKIETLFVQFFSPWISVARICSSWSLCGVAESFVNSRLQWKLNNKSCTMSAVQWRRKRRSKEHYRIQYVVCICVCVCARLEQEDRKVVNVRVIYHQSWSSLFTASQRWALCVCECDRM